MASLEKQPNQTLPINSPQTTWGTVTQWWSGWSIQRKLFVTYFFIFLIVAARLVANLVVQQQITDSVSKLSDDLLQEHRLLDTVLATSLTAQSKVKEYLLTGQEENLVESKLALDSMVNAVAALEEEGAVFEDEGEAEIEADLYAELWLSTELMVAAGNEAFTAIDTERASTERQIVLQQLESGQNRMLQAIENWEMHLEEEEEEIFLAISRTLQLSQIGSLSLLFFFLPVIFLGSFWGLQQAINRPLQRLVEATSQIEAGQLNVRIELFNRDEIGYLAEQFNRTMATIEQVVINNQRISKYLSLIDEVTRAINRSSLEDEFLGQTAEQIKNTLDLYHVQIYLLDPVKNLLYLHASTGEAGRTLLERNHAVELGRGLVGYAAVSRQPALVPDVSQAANWQSNPLLPDTRAEAVFPIIFEDELLGVLDMQDNIIGELAPDLVEPLQSIANGLAVALQNSRQVKTTLLREQFSRTILETITVPMLISRLADGKILYANDSLAALLHISLDLLKSKGTPDFYADQDDRGNIVADLQRNGVVVNFELRLKRTDDTLFWSLLSARVIEFEDSPAVITTLIDITERKLSESTLVKQANALLAVAEVGTAATTILQPDQLLQAVVDLTKERFALYHAHIFLLDADQPYLVLSAGAGEIGRQMVAEGRTISLTAESSLIASVARQRQGAIRNYAHEGEGFMPHPLLLETRSEMALPILLGNELLGVLDVRSTEFDYFHESEMQTFATLAAQVAVALQNARSFTRSDKAVRELQALSERLTREGWTQYLADRKRKLVYQHPAQPENGTAPDKTTSAPTAAYLTHPLRIQGATVGQLRLEAPTQYAGEAIEIVTAVAVRLSTHLETLRLTESSEMARADAEKLNEELGLINRMMSSVTTSLDLVVNMNIIAKEMMQALEVSHVGIALLTKDQNYLEVVSEYPEPTDDIIGTLIPVHGNPLAEQAIQTGKFAIAYDAQNNPLTAPIHDLMRQRGVHMLAVVPMIVGNEFFGTVGFDQTDPHRTMTEEKIRLAETIVYQAATVVQNARLFNQTQEALAETNEQARRLALLNDLSEAVSRQLTEEDMMATAIGKVTEILDAQRISLHLIDKSDDTMLRVAAVAGAAGSVEVGRMIPLAGSPMGEALNTKQIASGFFQIDEVALPAYFVPIFSGEHKFGTFNLALNAPDDELNENDRQIIFQIASVLAAALENMRLFEQTRQRAERERLLNSIVTRVAASLDLQHSLQIIVDEMATALNVDQVRVALLQPEMNELVIIAEHHAPTSQSVVGLKIPVAGNELTKEVIATRRMVVVEDAQNSPRTEPVHQMFREQGIQTVVLLPLVVNDKVLGTIGLDILDDRLFDQDTLQLAETIVYQAAVAIQNARLFEKSQAALAETETLYAYTSQLNTATNLDAVLDSAAAPGFQVGATDALLFVYDQDTAGHVQYGQFLASSPRNIVPLGQKMALSEQPFSQLWPSGGKNILFVGDIAEDKRLSPDDRARLAALKVQAVAILFLSVGNLRLGQIVIRWQNRQTFTSVDERLYGAIAQQASSVVYNRLLFTQTEEALSETAVLYQASADLNTAQTYDDVLTALRRHTVFGQDSHSVTISFFDRPWEPEQMPDEVQILATWGDSGTVGMSRFKIESVPGFRELVASAELLVHNDIVTDKQISDEFRYILLEMMHTRAAIYVPLIIGTRRVGFINGYYPRPMRFSEEQIRRLNVLVNQAAVSIQSIYLYEQTQMALSQTESLYTGSERIVLSNSEDDILQALVDSTELRKLERANIFLFDKPVEDGVADNVTVVAVWEHPDVPHMMEAGMRFLVEQVPFLNLLSPETSMVVSDVQQDERVDPVTRDILHQFGMNSFVLFPMVVGTQWLGVVAGQSSKPLQIDDVQLRQANSLVGQAAVVMQTTLLFRQEQARSNRERLLREIATKMRSSTDIDTIMRTAVTEIGRTLGRRSFIQLGNGESGNGHEENGATE